MQKVQFQYQTIEFKNMDIHLRTLKDKNQYDESYDTKDIDGLSSANWSLFGVLWPSGQVLSNIMQDYDIENIRILEVGCGVGLSSLILNHRNANITATDFNPEAKLFLDENTRINSDTDIPFVCANWKNQNDELGEFDLIIASDVLYEQFQLKDLSNFLQLHSKKESKIIVVDPGRGNSNKFTKIMAQLGFTHKEYKPENTDDYLDDVFKGKVITYEKTNL